MRTLIKALCVCACLAAIVAGSAQASAQHPCYQALIEYVNLPPAPSVFSRWTFYTGPNRHPRVLATGEFSFLPSTGGGYDRVVTACFTRNAYKPGLKAKVETGPFDTSCDQCRVVIRVRRVS